MKTPSILALLLLLLSVPAAWGQDEIVFEEGDVILGSIEDARRIENTLRIAEEAIMRYVDESTRSIQQGHRQGFAEFRVWYRDREAQIAAARATDELLKSVFGSVLKTGVNIIFPGSGTFMEKLRDYSVKAYDTVANKLGTVSAGDTNAFLDRHERAVEDYITDLLDVPQEFRDEEGELLETLKWEFIFAATDPDSGETSTSTELGAEMRRMLWRVGVMEPGSATARRFAEKVLTQQIFAVLKSETEGGSLRANITALSQSDWQRRIIAEATALRHLYNDPDRYCPVERRLSSFWQSPTCRNWTRSGR